MSSTEKLSADPLADASEANRGRVRWTICAMLFFATSINYMDRQVIALLKPTLAVKIGLTELNYAYIVDAFQVAYALGLLLAGRIVDRIGTRIGYMVVMGVWSLSAMGHALASSAMEFGVARFFLGLGESGNFPAAIKTVAEWFPQGERSLATGIFNSGANVGAILAPLVVPWITLRFGWRAAFLATGVFSMLWILWWFKNYRKPTDHPTLTGAELRYIYQEAAQQMGPSVPWLRLLGYRQTWAFALGKFLTDPIWWFYLFWLPSYFSAKFHLDLSHLGLPLILVYNMSAVGSIAGGWLPAPFRKMGLSPEVARLAAMGFCALLVVPVFMIGNLHSEWAAIILLGIAAGAHQGWSANMFTTASDMFPRQAVGAVVGIGGMAGSVGGVLLANFTGHVLQKTHNYSVLFVIASSVYLLALVVINLLAPKLRRAEFAA
ncbi:MFS transporter [Silvibacterium sp.]|uniref:MFS transporter n=1 Tax=Silvibacterium sp. TaxID=1964179 RepID=UPI0039E2F1FC